LTPQSADTQAPDDRFKRLESWLTRIYGARDLEVTRASEDASFRRYFRVRHRGTSRIAMDAPPGKEDVVPWLGVAAMLAEIGVNAPRLIERSIEDGFLLITDLGGRTYLAEIEAGGVANGLYDRALEALVAMQARASWNAERLPPYDEALLRREMGLFPEWFLGRHLELALDSDEVRDLAQVFDTLTASALAQPRVFVHRDYHSRNLMVCDGAAQGDSPGVLDFQDAMFGPVTYDLVSLLRDCYVAWPHDWVDTRVAQFRRDASAAGIDVGPDEGTFLEWFDLMGVQRHLKAIGIFARLWHRDGKPGYLKDIPRTLNYVREVSAARAGLEPLAELIERQVLPRMQAQ
jgi:aminoglycoside/choline kinase family phosphotransferase